MDAIERYIIGLDIGVVNLGLAVFDLHSHQFCLLTNVRLVPKGNRYYPSENVKLVRNFINEYREYFDNAHRIVLERQMRCNMRIIESVLHAMHYDITTIVNARSVKVHFGISVTGAGNHYAENKRRAVDWARNYISEREDLADSVITKEFRTCSKSDDIADAMLMVVYYLRTFLP